MIILTQRDSWAPIIAAISSASYRPPITKAPNRFACTQLYGRMMIKRINSLATRRWSGKFAVDGVKQGTKLIDRTLIITRCHGHYSKGTESPLYWTSRSLSIFAKISAIILQKNDTFWIQFVYKLKLYIKQKMYAYILENLRRLFNRNVTKWRFNIHQINNN